MTNVLATVTLPFRTFIPEDVAVNTFSWACGTEADATGHIPGALLEFYNTVPSSNALYKYMSNHIDFTQARIKLYNFSDPEPRAPFYDALMGGTWGSPSATTALPSEVSLVASFAAAPASGETAARRRGRIYLGPLNTDAQIATTLTPSRPTAAFIHDVAVACDRMATTDDADAQWVVHSRANNAWYTIVSGWVDNAWDTQRRRGVAATSREKWSV